MVFRKAASLLTPRSAACAQEISGTRADWDAAGFSAALSKHLGAEHEASKLQLLPIFVDSVIRQHCHQSWAQQAAALMLVLGCR